MAEVQPWAGAGAASATTDVNFCMVQVVNLLIVCFNFTTNNRKVSARDFRKKLRILGFYLKIRMNLAHRIGAHVLNFVN